MNNQLIDADLIKNKINFYSKNKHKEKKFKKISLQKTLELQLVDILKSKPKYACSYIEGLKSIENFEDKMNILCLICARK